MLSIYKASAGSGKTFTLTYEYIRMLLGVKNQDTGRYSLNRNGRERHRFILAVTFTNKATEEMKRRILHELAVLGGLEPGWKEESPFKERLMREFGCTADALRSASATALRSLLFDFNFFQVSTIDSFFQIVLRTFAREADLMGNYEVELDEDRSIRAGVRQMFDSLSVNSGESSVRATVNWLTDFMLRELEQGRGGSLFNRSASGYASFIKMLKSVSNDVFTVNYTSIMDYLAQPDKLERFGAEVREAVKLYLKDAAEQAAHTLEVIRKRGYDGSSKLKVNSYLIKVLVNVAGGNPDLSKAPSKVVVSAAENVGAAYLKDLKSFLDANPDDELDASISAACKAAVGMWRGVPLLHHIDSNIYVMGLLKKVYHYVEQYRNETNTVLLSDTNGLLRDIIGDDDTPFVYERVGVWLNHFLIDEFQDTSRLQWENMLPLLKEGQASGHDSLIIGDEKQCIYRFRFSDPDLLGHEVKHAFGENAMVSGDTAEGNTNWRSSADVVMFNNELFRHLGEKLGFGGIYANVHQQVSAKHEAHRGFVKINAIPDENKENTYTRAALRVMTDNIRRQLRSGYDACDIVVLARGRGDATKAIDCLMELIESDADFKDLRIVSDDALYVASAPVVRLILSVLRCLSTPQATPDSTDGTSRSRRKLRQRELKRLINRYEYLRTREPEADEALRQALLNPEADDELSADIGAMTCFNLPSTVERIITRYVTPDVAAAQSVYVAAFQDVVADFCSFGPCGISDFLNWWDSTGHKARISAPFDRNAIRVMTIHKSKGLEFKCVHIPFARWDIVTFKDVEWFYTDGGNPLPGISPATMPPLLPLRPSDKMVGSPFEAQYLRRCDECKLDELNVLYVAMTRAVDELCVSYCSSFSSTADYASRPTASSLLHAAVPSISEMDGCDRVVCVDSETEVAIRTYTMGAPTQAVAGGEKQSTALEPSGIVAMPGYYSLDRDDLWANTRIDNLVDYSQPRERGLVLHKVMEQLLHATQLERALNNCVRNGSMPVAERDDVRRHLSDQLERPEIRRWFEGFRHVARERNLITGQGEECRPDRVVWHTDGTVDVIDYKTGAEHPRKYARQVRRYVDELRRMGHDNVTGYLWYLDSGEIVKVD